MEPTDVTCSVRTDEQFDNIEVLEISNDISENELPCEVKSEINNNESVIELTDKNRNNEPITLELLSDKSEEGIIAIFTEFLSKNSLDSLRKDIELLKTVFYKTRITNFENAKKEYINTHSTEEGFELDNSENEIKFKALLAEYRAMRDEETKKQDEEKESNYKEKIQIIEELKELSNSSETINITFAAFKELQKRWRNSGNVSKSHVKGLWENYHLQVENFYNFVKINNELRDLDLKKNYTAKLALVEEAENLSLGSSILNMFQSLQKLHEDWREIGPVSLEYKESLWERLKNASTKINKLHQDHFEAIRQEQLKNYEMKLKLCDEAQLVLDTPKTTHKEWVDASDKIIEIQKVWKTIGFAPKKENNIVYARFRDICDKFFAPKTEFYETMKNDMDNNLNAKMLLCTQAEAISEGSEWKKGTEQILELQKEWKLIGAVPRKNFDVIWKRFRTACDNFFERKATHFNSLDSKHEGNLNLKKQIIESLKSFYIEKHDDAFEVLKSIQKEWTEIGFVPMKNKDSIQKEYRELIDTLFETLRSQGKERRMSRFKERVSQNSDTGRSMKGEKERLLSKIDSLNSDILLLENNIGFFAKSKGAESLINDVNAKINKAKKDIIVYKEQIKIINLSEKQ